MVRLLKKLIMLYLIVGIFCGVLEAGDIDIRIGVLAKRGVAKTLERWKPMSDHLNKNMKGYNVTIVPLLFDKVESAITKKEIDFILTNSSYYVTLEMKYGVSQIATMYNLVNKDVALDKFGGVIFVQSSRDDINRLQDIVGKRFAAVDKASFGGWQMAWYEIKKAGINVEKDFSSLIFTHTHDGAVNAVLEGKVDVGTARTDTLEKMANENKIDLKDIKVINAKNYSGFPLLVSTQLYPEWPLAIIPGTPKEIAKELTTELFKIEAGCECAILSGIGGWTAPADYKSVHDTLKALRIEPYEGFHLFSLKDVITTYWYYFLGVIIIFIVLILRYLYILKIKKITDKVNISLEKKVLERTEELNNLNKTLEKRVAHEVLKNRKKDQEILVQSRYAAMGEMLNMLAHQWRQPIGGIEMGINNILMDLEFGIDNTDELKETLTEISGEIQHLSHIINDFSLRFKDDSIVTDVKPEEVMDEVLSVIQSSIDNQKITIEKNYNNTSELKLSSRQLFQVYLNIVNNSVEILLERAISDAKIVISIEENQEYIISTICDNGGGIDKQYIEKIFEPYFSTKKEKNDTGLGLYITKTIIEKHLHGTIDVKTEDNKTCFVIQIKK